ncbi:hypothetical protein JCM10207_005548 [Rhodosporidiobolus poonsookiae]
MDKLPNELLLQIAGHLVRDREPWQGIDYLTPAQKTREGRLATQARLSALSQAKRRFHRVLSPLLYSSPILRSVEAAASWSQGHCENVNPFTLAKGVDVVQACARSLELLYPPIRVISTSSNNGKNMDVESYFPAQPPSLDRLVALRTFDHLTSIQFRNVHIDNSLLPLLVGPSGSHRARIQCLEVSRCLPGPRASARTINFLLDILPWIVDDFESDLDAETRLGRRIDDDSRKGLGAAAAVQSSRWDERWA